MVPLRVRAQLMDLQSNIVLVLRKLFLIKLSSSVKLSQWTRIPQTFRISVLPLSSSNTFHGLIPWSPKILCHSRIYATLCNSFIRTWSRKIKPLMIKQLFTPTLFCSKSITMHLRKLFSNVALIQWCTKTRAATAGQQSCRRVWISHFGMRKANWKHAKREATRCSHSARMQTPNAIHALTQSRTCLRSTRSQSRPPSKTSLNKLVKQRPRVFFRPRKMRMDSFKILNWKLRQV